MINQNIQKELDNIECIKTKYSTEKLANEDIQRIQKTSDRSKIPHRCYYCFNCYGWHLTSTNSIEEKKIIFLKKEIEKQQVLNDSLNKTIEKKVSVINLLMEKIENQKSALYQQHQLISKIKNKIR